MKEFSDLIKNIDFSDLINNINSNISMSELEKRLKPEDRSNYSENKNEWRDNSSGGFLSPNESLSNVIARDYETLISLGKTYEEMAKLASNVLNQYNLNQEFSRKNKLNKLFTEISGNYTSLVTIDSKKFSMIKLMSMGHQTCPWGCVECSQVDKFGYSTTGSGHIIVEKLGMNNDENKLIMRYLKHEKNIVEFGGLSRINYLDAFTIITDLTPHLIASHYFFQGEASYRTDPKKLLELTGQLK